MSQNLKFFLIITSITLAIDIYVWQGVKFLTNGWTDKAKLILKISYWGYTSINFLFFLTWRLGIIHMPALAIKLAMTVSVIITLGKVFWVLFLVIDDVARVFRWLYSLLPIKANESVTSKEGISRLKFINYLGLGVGSAFVGSAIWGIAKGAHNYKVRKRILKIPNLDPSFQGFKIAQISDIHSGSFWSTDAVHRGVNMVKKQKADMVFFTGDIVNDQAIELKPYLKMFSEIKAPHGVYSILGNHDYGDYHLWPDKKQFSDPKPDKSHMSPLQKANLEMLMNMHGEMGWKLLLDEHKIVEKDGAKLAVIGIENWSNKGRFPKYGNLQKAYAGTENIPLKLLLSHDPSHWKAEVLNKYKDINVTFSGHTHGMQFGVDSRFYRWSPVKYLYKEWLDLYTENSQHLYVNRGFGYLGFPGRIGVFPEITVFTLEKA